MVVNGGELQNDQNFNQNQNQFQNVNSNFSTSNTRATTFMPSTSSHNDQPEQVPQEQSFRFAPQVVAPMHETVIANSTFYNANTGTSSSSSSTSKPKNPNSYN